MAYTYKYPRPAVTADCIVITKEAEPKVLLIQRGNPPFKGAWAFPGGFMDMDETTEQCAIRELEEETLHGLVVNDISSVAHLSRNTAIAIATLMLMKDALNLIALMLVLDNAITGCLQVVIEYGARHPINLQQEVETIFRP